MIQKLRFAVKHDEKLDLKDSKWEDIHVITGALKMFFRELPEPLFTFNHFNDFVNAISKYVVALSFPPDVENPLYIWIKLLQFL